MPAGGATLYAKWTAANQHLIYDANTGAGSMSDSVQATGTVFNLTTNAFTKAGYTFAGWSTTAGGSVAYADGASYTMPAGGATLYAK